MENRHDWFDSYVLYSCNCSLCVLAFQLCVNERVTATHINVLFAWTYIKTSNLNDYINHFLTRTLLIILRWLSYYVCLPITCILFHVKGYLRKTYFWRLLYTYRCNTFSLTRRKCLLLISAVCVPFGYTCTLLIIVRVIPLVLASKPVLFSSSLQQYFWYCFSFPLFALRP